MASEEKRAWSVWMAAGAIPHRRDHGELGLPGDGDIGGLAIGDGREAGQQVELRSPLGGAELGPPWWIPGEVL
jgi:hypothetical protein